MGHKLLKRARLFSFKDQNITKIAVHICIYFLLTTASSIFFTSISYSKKNGTLGVNHPDYPACCSTGACQCGSLQNINQQQSIFSQDLQSPLLLGETINEKQLIQNKSLKLTEKEEIYSQRANVKSLHLACSKLVKQKKISKNSCKKFRNPVNEALLKRQILVNKDPVRKKCGKVIEKIWKSDRNFYENVFSRIAANGLNSSQSDLKLSTDYLENCFGDQIDGWIAREAKEAILFSLQDHIGFIFDKNVGKVKCTAAKSGQRIITAKHCFPVMSLEKRNWFFIDTKRFVFVDLEMKEWKVEILKGGKKLHLVDQAGKWKREDWIVLKLPDIPQGPKLEISNFDTKLGPLIIPGYFRFVAGLKPATKENLKELVLFDLSPNCISSFSNEKFLLHSCQTIQGVSGAPIFQRSKKSGKYRLVGLHNGTTDALIFDSQFPCACAFHLAQPNYGLKVNKKMSDALNSLN